MTITQREAQRQYDVLTKRIEALDTDIGRELDSDRRVTLEERRAALQSERDAVQNALGPNKYGNSDLDALKVKVDQLSSAMIRDNPAEAQRIISDTIDTLRHMSARLDGVEGRVAAIERRMSPPLSVTLWRVMASLAFLVGLVLFLAPDTRTVLFGVLWLGAFLEAVLLVMAAAFWRIGMLTAEKPQPERGQ